MIHKFKKNGIFVVLDVNSGAVHVVDEMVYEILDHYPEQSKEETITKLTETYASDSGVTSKLEAASMQKQVGPLQFLEDMVPDNAFGALSDNSLMLQVIFFTIFLGISMLLIGEKRSKPLKKFFDSLNDVIEGHVKSRGAGEFKVPGLMKVKVNKKINGSI